MDRDNRKSHLAPQLSPATQELLRGSDSPTQTPTQGEIPVIVLTSTPHNNLGSPSDGSPVRERHGSAGRAGGPSVHPRLGSRVVSTSRSISRLGEEGDDEMEYLSPRTRPKTQTVYAPNFSLPIRPCPPARRRPPEVQPQPQPQRQSVLADGEGRKEDRRRGFVASGPTPSPTRKGTI